MLEKFIIYRHIGSLSEADNGWIKDLNFVSWNDREPVYDIRTWNEEHTKYGKGVTATSKQMAALKELLNQIDSF